jgi:hypothetical protein
MKINLYTNALLNNSYFYHFNFIEELEFIFQTKFIVVEKHNFSNNCGVHIFFCLAKWLFSNVDKVNNLIGPKYFIEHDGYLNFINESPYYNSWNIFCKQIKDFNKIFISGEKTTQKFCLNGIQAKWLPKACDKKMLLINNKFTGDICSFGTSIAQIQSGKKLYFYKKRNEMQEKIEGKVTLFQSSVQLFANNVVCFSAGCQNDATMGEPMSKHFECSAMGCVVIRDEQPELYKLGYDDLSMIVYRDFNELLDIVNFYKRNPESLVPFQIEAKKRTMIHTWENRAIQIKNEIYKTIKMI